MRHLVKPGLQTVMVLLCLANPAMALPDDKEQPINIKSARAEQVTKKDGEVTTYTGAVVMTQGSMRLEGDTVTIYSKKRKVDKVIALGKPARFQQQSASNESPVLAHGNRIVYNVPKEVIVLLNDASIQQDNSTVNAQRIEYRITTERIKAKGSTGADPAPVHMVLEPATLKKDDDVKADSE